MKSNYLKIIPLIILLLMVLFYFQKPNPNIKKITNIKTTLITNIDPNPSTNTYYEDIKIQEYNEHVVNHDINVEHTINNIKQKNIINRDKKIEEIRKTNEFITVHIIGEKDSVNIAFKTIFFNFNLNEEFVSELQSYGVNFIPLDTLIETEKNCFNESFEAFSHNKKTISIDESGYKHTYFCDFLYIEEKKYYYKWIEIF